MAMHRLVGHQQARQRLARSVRSDRLPQVLVVVGPAGVGKQRLALWLAQQLLCEQPGAEPCGRCRSCRQVEGLVHPDVHWFVPIARPKATDADKQVEEAAEALAQAMEDRRARSLYVAPDGMASHGMASVRLLRRRAALTPVSGKRKVFILGDADRLVPQEASPDAANALLKLLEEPPADSVFVLTTVDARRLLPTIRSRAVVLRLGRLTDEEVAEVLRSGGAATDALRVPAAGGSVGAALAAGEVGGAAYDAAREMLEAILEGRAGVPARMERALRQTPWAARGEFTAMLDALADTLGDAARAALGEQPRRTLPDSLRSRRDPAALIRAIDRVADAREAAAGNVNPQLLLATLGEELAEVL
ncbi:MAG: ATP-binding protein [Gemmatimonadota bacterium]